MTATTTLETRQLGNTDTHVTKICLGTMTWGQQNTEAEAHEQLDYATEAGVNFIDAAEMYPVPGRAETCGRTEKYIGTWLASRKNRDKVVLATKVAGPAKSQTWIRGEDNQIDRTNITQAIEGSLSQLQTDYVDLYQIHWPNRVTNFFSQRQYSHYPKEDQDAVLLNMKETVETMGDLIQAGKIRHWGLSNENPWGTMTFLRLCDELNLPRPVSVQNPYSLLNRTFEHNHSEVALREKVGLLAYSPLAFGRLSGKYERGEDTPQDRLNQFPVFDRYNTNESKEATKAYIKLAEANNMTVIQMALAFVSQQRFVTSNIIGATSLVQLKENIDTAQVTISKEVCHEINAIQERFPNPAP